MGYYDYEEYYCQECGKIDPTKANEIEEEAVEQFRAYMHERLAEEAKALEKERASLIELANSLTNREHELNSREREIKKLEEKIGEREKAIRSQIEQEYKEKFFDRFTPGSRIWFYKLIPNSETCPVCGGKRKINHDFLTLSGQFITKKIDCPLCNYDGVVTTSYGYKIYEGTITFSRIIIESTREELRIQGDDLLCHSSRVNVEYEKDGRKDTIEFGSDFDNRIFLSKEKCELMAKQRAEQETASLKKILTKQ